MAKKYRRYRDIPFNKKVGEREYQRVRRSEEPVKEAMKLGILDLNRLKQLLREVNNLTTASLCLIYVGILTNLLILKFL